VSQLWIMATKFFPGDVDYRTVEDYVVKFCGNFDFQKAHMNMVVPEVTHCGTETITAIRKHRLRMAVYPVMLTTGRAEGKTGEIVNLPWSIVLNKTSRVLLEKRLHVGKASIENAEKLQEELERVTYQLANPTKPIDPDKVEETPTRDPLAIATMLALWGLQEHGPRGFSTGRRSHIAPKYNPFTKEARV